MPKELRATSRQVTLIALLGALLPACGGKSETTQPPAAVHDDTSQLFASGTRLKAHYLDGGGGARKLLAFHDSLLDIECQFVETTAEQYACLPMSSTGTFADSACTAPTFPAPSACPGVPPLAAGQLISAPASDCTAQFGAYSLDTLQSAATADRGFSLTVFGACWSPSSQPAPRAQWTTKPEPLAHFVRGTSSTVGVAGGIEATRVTGDDGAFTTLELVADGAACTPIPFGSVERCVPQPLAQTYPNAYADSSCTDANVAFAGVTIAQQCAGVQAAYQLTSTFDNCRVDSTIYGLGEPLSRVFANLSSCAAIDLTDPSYDGDSFYRAGPLVSAAVLPVAHSTQIGAGAVTVGYYTDSAGTAIAARGSVASFGEWALPDGAECTLLNDASGQRRCVHDALIVDTANSFADASCTEPVYTDDLECAPSSFRYIVVNVSDRCSSMLTGVYTATLYSGPRYSLQSGSCQPDPYSTANPYYSLGDPVDDAIFPLITDITDP